MSRHQSQGSTEYAERPCRPGRASAPRHVRLQRAIWGRSLAMLWIAAILALVGVVGLSGHAQARAGRATAAITILSETQSDSYPSQMIFHLTASDSNASITGAQLEISVPAEQVDHQIDVPVSQSGAQVSLSYTYDASNDYLPPFTPITYHWKLSDSAQASFTAPNQQFDFVDTRFTWQHLTQNDITVYWYNQDTSFGQTVLNTAVSEASSIEQDLNGTLTHPLRVFVYASSDDLHGGLPPNSPNWAGGVALIELYQCLIVVGGNEEPLQRDLPHELTHLIFHEIAGLDCGGCPLWFDEGMAVYHQLYHEPDMQFRFDEAVHANALLPFNSIADRFSQDSDKAELAYAQSWNFIEYLYKQFGQPKVARLVDELATKNFYSAFSQDFGMDVPHLESQWHVSLGLPPINSNTPATPTTDQTTTTNTGSGNQGQTIGLLGLGLVALLLLGLVGGFVWWRRSQAPAPAPGFGPQPPFGAVPPQGFQPDMQNGWPQGTAMYPPAPGQSGSRPVPPLSPYEQLAGQRRQVLQAMNNLLVQEKQLISQYAYLESQIGYVAEYERAVQAKRPDDLAHPPSQPLQHLKGQLLILRQQREQVDQQKQQMLQAERQLSAQIEALLHQQASQPPADRWASPAPWPQPPGQMTEQLVNRRPAPQE